MRRLLTTTAVAAAAAWPATAHAQPAPPLTAEVLKVVDGDTIDVRDDQRGRLRLRIIGIDTPETLKPQHTVGCWGPEASTWAKQQLQGQRVAIIVDPTQDKTDKYGRTLVYVQKANGWDYSTEAARAGNAKSVVYGKKPSQRQPQIEAAQREAQTAKRGLWGPPCNGNTESVPK